MLNKEVLKKIDISPMQKPKGNIGVAFYNQDINTATLKFQVTKEGQPVSFSDNTSQTLIAIKTADGSFFVDEMEVLDALNGVIAFTLNDDILARTGEATGQIYINTNGEKTTVATVTFNFNINAALINEIDGELKIVYIRTIEDLKEQVRNSLKPLEQQIEQVNNLLASGGYVLTEDMTAAINTVTTAVDDHKADKNNPHSVTKAQVGLSNVDNTADTEKPVSTPQKSYIDNKVQTLTTTISNDLTAMQQQIATDVETNINSTVAATVQQLVNQNIEVVKSDILAEVEMTLQTTEEEFYTAVDALKPVLLFEGAVSLANEAAGTLHTLADNVKNYKYYRIMYGFAGGNYRVKEWDSVQTIPTIMEFNLQDADAAQPRMYEFMLDFSEGNAFSIAYDHVYNLTTANASLNGNTLVIRRIEGLRY